MSQKILVVDDSPTMRNLLTHSLARANYEVVMAEDGVDGLEKFSQHNPNLVIADINMPRMNGVDMIKAIRDSNGVAVPIVVLTTEVSDEYKAKMREAGANAWIAKPYEDDVILGVIKQFLN